MDMTTAPLTIDRPLRLGTRRSPLAMAQAEETKARLLAAHGWTDDRVELVPVIASGDKVLDRPLADIGGKALWTKELDFALGEGLIDIAVHSMKDVETIRPDVFALAAVLPREDVRDRLIGAATIDALAHGARVGTSSPRRRAQLLVARPDLEIALLRGNVQRRMAAVADGEVDATLLAAAGLNRLGLTQTGAALPLTSFLPCAAQGAIGIECRADDAATKAWLAPLDCARSHAEVLAERAFLAAIGASCHSALALLARLDDSGEGVLQAVLYAIDGSAYLAGETAFTPGDDAAPAALARDMLGRAPATIRAEFGSDEPGC